MTEPINLLDGGDYRDPSISPEGTRDTAPLDPAVAPVSYTHLTLPTTHYV